MGLVIEPLPEHAATIGPAASKLESLAESRLHTADLYRHDALTFLRIRAGHRAIELQYMKPVIDLASNETETVRTFSRTVAVRDWTAADVMLEVSKLLDLFLVEYARVNEPACGEADAMPRRAGTDMPPRPGSSDPLSVDLVEKPPPGRSPEASPPQAADAIQRGHMRPPSEDKETVHRVGGNVTQPRLNYKVEPEFSEEARKARVDGTVMLAVEIGKDGSADNIRVLRSVGYGLDEKAIEAVKKWEFDPARNNGEPVKVIAQFQISFRLGVNPKRRRR